MVQNLDINVIGLYHFGVFILRLPAYGNPAFGTQASTYYFRAPSSLYKLWSNLFEGGYIGDYIGEYSMGYSGGY